MGRPAGTVNCTNFMVGAVILYIGMLTTFMVLTADGPAAVMCSFLRTHDLLVLRSIARGTARCAVIAAAVPRAILHEGKYLERSWDRRLCMVIACAGSREPDVMVARGEVFESTVRDRREAISKRIWSCGLTLDELLRGDSSHIPVKNLEAAAAWSAANEDAFSDWVWALCAPHVTVQGLLDAIPQLACTDYKRGTLYAVERWFRCAGATSGDARNMFIALGDSDLDDRGTEVLKWLWKQSSGEITSAEYVALVRRALANEHVYSAYLLTTAIDAPISTDEHLALLFAAMQQSQNDTEDDELTANMFREMMDIHYPVDPASRLSAALTQLDTYFDGGKVRSVPE